MKRILIGWCLCILACLALGVAHAQTRLDTNEAPIASLGELEIQNEAGHHDKALLLSTKITGEVNGLVASVEIEQAFTNQSSDWVNGRYVIPLPDQAAVNRLHIKLGERLIVGEVQEKKQAQKTFQQAQAAGKKASLLEQHRNNLFSINVANIAPGETIEVTLGYIDQVKFDAQQFHFMLPTTLTPRYITGSPFIELPSEPLQEASNAQLPLSKHLDPVTGWSLPTASVPDADAITPPQIHAQANQNSHQFELRLVVDPGLAIGQIASRSHAIQQRVLEDNKLEITLRDGSDLLDRDLHLNWSVADSDAAQAALFKQFNGELNAHFNMLMVVPPAGHSESLPREVTFIIDSSGSMGGTSMEQAKQALRHAMRDLSVNDRFNIVDFDSQFRPLFGQPRFATQDNLAFGSKMIDRLHADGGTEMLGALEFALGQPVSEGYLQQIIFITDGSIGNEQELLRLINERLGDSRLFTIAIGSAPNTYFMRKAAKFGRGFYLPISDVNQVREQMQLLTQRIKRPLLRDITIDWSHPVEQYPNRLPDLYAGEPIMVLVKSASPITKVKVSGQLASQKWTQTLQQAAQQSSDQPGQSHIDTLWARAKIEHLMESLLTAPQQLPQIRERVIALGLAHQLTSKFTSFVAVEKRISRPSGVNAKHKNVPNLMPRGSTMLAPQTATAADLLTLLGVLCLFLALCWRRGSEFRWPALME